MDLILIDIGLGDREGPLDSFCPLSVACLPPEYRVGPLLEGGSCDLLFWGKGTGIEPRGT